MSQPPGPSRRSPFRFLYQFSLRTLLLATAAVAVFCNWYFEPKYREEKLAGTELRLRRQVKTRGIHSGKLTPVQENLSQPEIVNHGNWSLLDADEVTLGRGRFVENQATANWAAWYPTGGKAAEGKMQQGVKVGCWRTWYEDGTLASETEFTSQPLTRERLVDESSAYYVQIGCVMLSRREPVGGRLAMEFVCCRDGRARAWYPSGELQFEGEYRLGLRHGPWTFFDKDGNVTASGPFRAGKRHGDWTFTTGRPTHYIDGRTQSELNEVLARLKPLLTSDRRRQRYAALIDLADIGEGAAPLLIERLENGDGHEQAAVVGMLPRMPSGVQLLLPRVRELQNSRDERLAHVARLALFQLDLEARTELFEPLLREAIEDPTLGQCLEELTVLCRRDEAFRGRVFATLMELPIIRDDSDASRVADEAANMGGDVTQFVRTACSHQRWQVRLQAVHTIERLKGWFGYVSPSRLDKQAIDELLSQLQHDASHEVRLAAKALTEQPVFGGPSGNWGVGTGFTGGSSF